ncbi:protein phosphatase 2C domain-containing protein [Nocardia sp. NPDC003345]
MVHLLHAAEERAAAHAEAGEVMAGKSGTGLAEALDRYAAANERVRALSEALNAFPGRPGQAESLPGTTPWSAREREPWYTLPRAAETPAENPYAQQRTEDRVPAEPTPGLAVPETQRAVPEHLEATAGRAESPDAGQIAPASPSIRFGDGTELDLAQLYRTAENVFGETVRAGEVSDRAIRQAEEAESRAAGEGTPATEELMESTRRSREIAEALSEKYRKLQDSYELLDELVMYAETRPTTIDPDRLRTLVGHFHAVTANPSRVTTDLGSVAGSSDIGIGPAGDGHHNNQDAYAVAKLVVGGRLVQVAVVADGTSTSTKSELASATAVGTARDHLVEALRKVGSDGRFDPLAMVRAATAAAADAVEELGRQLGTTPATPPACTITVALVEQNQLTVDWRGDTRAYWLTPDASGSRRLTEDDSIVPMLMRDDGVRPPLTEEEALALQFSHTLYRYLGNPEGDAGESHAYTVPIEGPGLLFIGTDGAWGKNFAAESLAATVYGGMATRPGSLSAGLEAVEQHAIDARDRDNVTGVLIDPAAPVQRQEGTREAGPVVGPARSPERTEAPGRTGDRIGSRPERETTALDVAVTPGDTRLVARLRRQLGELLHDWRAGDQIGPAELLISELAAAGLDSGEPFRVTASITGEPGNRSLRVEVTGADLRPRTVERAGERIPLGWAQGSLRSLSHRSGTDTDGPTVATWFEMDERIAEPAEGREPDRAPWESRFVAGPDTEGTNPSPTDLISPGTKESVNPLDGAQVVRSVIESSSRPVQWNPLAAELPDDVLLASAAVTDISIGVIRSRWEEIGADYVRSGWRVGGGLLFRGDPRPGDEVWGAGFLPKMQKHDGEVVYTTVRVDRAAVYGEAVSRDNPLKFEMVHRIYVIDAPGGFGMVDESGGVVSVHWPGGVRGDRIMGCFEIPAAMWHGEFAAVADELPRFWQPNPGYLPHAGGPEASATQVAPEIPERPAPERSELIVTGPDSVLAAEWRIRDLLQYWPAEHAETAESLVRELGFRILEAGSVGALLIQMTGSRGNRVLRVDAAGRAPESETATHTGETVPSDPALELLNTHAQRWDRTVSDGYENLWFELDEAAPTAEVPTDSSPDDGRIGSKPTPGGDAEIPRTTSVTGPEAAALYVPRVGDLAAEMRGLGPSFAYIEDLLRIAEGEQHGSDWIDSPDYWDWQLNWLRERSPRLSMLAAFSGAALEAEIAVGLPNTGPGPLLIEQARPLTPGETLHLYKYRTMPSDTPEQPSGPDIAQRASIIGSIQRELSLDEIAQYTYLAMLAARPLLQADRDLTRQFLTPAEFGHFDPIPRNGLYGANYPGCRALPRDQRAYFRARFTGDALLPQIACRAVFDRFLNHWIEPYQLRHAEQLRDGFRGTSAAPEDHVGRWFASVVAETLAAPPDAAPDILGHALRTYLRRRTGISAPADDALWHFVSTTAELLAGDFDFGHYLQRRNHPETEGYTRTVREVVLERHTPAALARVPFIANVIGAVPRDSADDHGRAQHETAASASQPDKTPDPTGPARETPWTGSRAGDSEAPTNVAPESGLLPETLRMAEQLGVDPEMITAASVLNAINPIQEVLKGLDPAAQRRVADAIGTPELRNWLRERIAADSEARDARDRGAPFLRIAELNGRLMALDSALPDVLGVTTVAPQSGQSPGSAPNVRGTSNHTLAPPKLDVDPGRESTEDVLREIRALAAIAGNAGFTGFVTAVDHFLDAAFTANHPARPARPELIAKLPAAERGTALLAYRAAGARATAESIFGPAADPRREMAKRQAIVNWWDRLTPEQRIAVVQDAPQAVQRNGRSPIVSRDFSNAASELVLRRVVVDLAARPVTELDATELQLLQYARRLWDDLLRAEQRAAPGFAVTLLQFDPENLVGLVGYALADTEIVHSPYWTVRVGPGDSTWVDRLFQPGPGEGVTAAHPGRRRGGEPGHDFDISLGPRGVLGVRLSESEQIRAATRARAEFTRWLTTRNEWRTAEGAETAAAVIEARVRAALAGNTGEVRVVGRVGGGAYGERGLVVEVIDSNPHPSTRQHGPAPGQDYETGVIRLDDVESTWFRFGESMISPLLPPGVAAYEALGARTVHSHNPDPEFLSGRMALHRLGVSAEVAPDFQQTHRPPYPAPLPWPPGAVGAITLDPSLGAGESTYAAAVAAWSAQYRALGLGLAENKPLTTTNPGFLDPGEYTWARYAGGADMVRDGAYLLRMLRAIKDAVAGVHETFLPATDTGRHPAGPAEDLVHVTVDLTERTFSARLDPAAAHEFGLPQDPIEGRWRVRDGLVLAVAWLPQRTATPTAAGDASDTAQQRIGAPPRPASAGLPGFMGVPDPDDPFGEAHNPIPGRNRRRNWVEGLAQQHATGGGWPRGGRSPKPIGADGRPISRSHELAPGARRAVERAQQEAAEVAAEALRPADELGVDLRHVYREDTDLIAHEISRLTETQARRLEAVLRRHVLDRVAVRVLANDAAVADVRDNFDRVRSHIDAWRGYVDEVREALAVLAADDILAAAGARRLERGIGLMHGSDGSLRIVVASPLRGQKELLGAVAPAVREMAALDGIPIEHWQVQVGRDGRITVATVSGIHDEPESGLKYYLDPDDIAWMKDLVDDRTFAEKVAAAEESGVAERTILKHDSGDSTMSEQVVLVTYPNGFRVIEKTVRDIDQADAEVLGSLISRLAGSAAPPVLRRDESGLVLLIGYVPDVRDHPMDYSSVRRFKHTPGWRRLVLAENLLRTWDRFEGENLGVDHRVRLVPIDFSNSFLNPELDFPIARLFAGALDFPPQELDAVREAIIDAESAFERADRLSWYSDVVSHFMRFQDSLEPTRPPRTTLDDTVRLLEKLRDDIAQLFGVRPDQDTPQAWRTIVADLRADPFYRRDNRMLRQIDILDGFVKLHLHGQLLQVRADELDDEAWPGLLEAYLDGLSHRLSDLADGTTTYPMPNGESDAEWQARFDREIAASRHDTGAADIGDPVGPTVAGEVPARDATGARPGRPAHSGTVEPLVRGLDDRPLDDWRGLKQQQRDQFRNLGIVHMDGGGAAHGHRPLESSTPVDRDTSAGIGAHPRGTPDQATTPGRHPRPESWGHSRSSPENLNRARAALAAALGVPAANVQIPLLRQALTFVQAPLPDLGTDAWEGVSRRPRLGELPALLGEWITGHAGLGPAPSHAEKMRLRGISGQLEQALSDVLGVAVPRTPLYPTADTAALQKLVSSSGDPVLRHTVEMIDGFLELVTRAESNLGWPAGPPAELARTFQRLHHVPIKGVGKLGAEDFRELVHLLHTLLDRYPTRLRGVRLMHRVFDDDTVLMAQARPRVVGRELEGAELRVYISQAHAQEIPPETLRSAVLEGFGSVLSAAGRWRAETHTRAVLRQIRSPEAGENTDNDSAEWLHDQFGPDGLDANGNLDVRRALFGSFARVYTEFLGDDISALPVTDGQRVLYDLLVGMAEQSDFRSEHAFRAPSTEAEKALLRQKHELLATVRTTLGIDLVGLEMVDIDLETVRDIVGELLSHHHEFGDVTNLHAMAIVPYHDENCFGYTNSPAPGRSTVVLNERWLVDRETMRLTINALIEDGHFIGPLDQPVRLILAHELGHVLYDFVQNNRDPVDEPETLLQWDLATVIYELHTLFQDSDPADDSDKAFLAWLKEVLSGYSYGSKGSIDIDEALAEARATARTLGPATPEAQRIMSAHLERLVRTLLARLHGDPTSDRADAGLPPPENKPSRTADTATSAPWHRRHSG